MEKIKRVCFIVFLSFYISDLVYGNIIDELDPSYPKLAQASSMQELCIKA